MLACRLEFIMYCVLLNHLYLHIEKYIEVVLWINNASRPGTFTIIFA